MSSASPVLFRHRTELLDFLLEVSEMSAGTLELEKLLPTLAEMVKRVIDYEIFAILLVGPGEVMRIRFAIGHREEVVRSLRIRVGEGITGAAAAARRPVLVGDVRRDARYVNALDAVRSELAVPMVARGRVVGVIDIQATRLNAFSAQDLSLAGLIASRVAMAIDNVRLFRKVVRQNRTLETLSAMAREFSSILELDPLLRKISELTRQLIRYDAFSILLLKPAEAALKHYISVRFSQQVQEEDVPLGRGIVGAAAESARPVLVPDTSRDPRYIACYPGLQSEVAVPLVLKNRVIGVLDLESAQVNYFNERHVQMLELLAPQIATAIENARLYQSVAEKEGRLARDLEAARRLQQHLLPQECPRVEGMELAARCEPARQIGGDLYEFSRLPKKRLGIQVADVSGKGAAAALYAAVMNGLLRTLAPQHRSPGELLSALNRVLLERQIESRYVALLSAKWLPEARTLVLANAGMPLPIICRGGRVSEQRVEGVPLGLLPNTEYEEVRVSVEPGDVVVLVSDGVTDARDRFGQDYGHERLAAAVERHAAGPAGALLEAILGDVRRHAGEEPSFDDQTAVVIRGK